MRRTAGTAPRLSVKSPLVNSVSLIVFTRTDMCCRGDCRLSRVAQALAARFLAGCQPLRLTSRLLVVLPPCRLPACASGGFSLEQGRGRPHHSTPATSRPSQTPPMPDALSDEATIRNAVSSADIESLGGQAAALGERRHRLARRDHRPGRIKDRRPALPPLHRHRAKASTASRCSRARPAWPAPAPGACRTSNAL